MATETKSPTWTSTSPWSFLNSSTRMSALFSDSSKSAAKESWDMEFPVPAAMPPVLAAALASCGVEVESSPPPAVLCAPGGRGGGPLCRGLSGPGEFRARSGERPARLPPRQAKQHRFLDAELRVVEQSGIFGRLQGRDGAGGVPLITRPDVGAKTVDISRNPL